MSLLKRIVRSAAGRRIMARLGAGYIRLVYRTSRWTMVGRETPERYLAENKPFIGCFWHNRILMMPYIWNVNRPLAMLISMHSDGLLISEIIGNFGIRTIAGSTSRGGTEALRSMVRTLKSGVTIGVTPDGPRGPRMHAAVGVVHVARLAQVPLLPMSISTGPRTMLRSWDRFLVSLPFTRGVFIYGRPIEVAPDADESQIEAARLALEAEINRVSAEGDRLVGQIPVDPA